MTQRGARRAIGPSSTGRTRHNVRSVGLRDGQVSWAMWANSCAARSAAQSGAMPRSSDGPGGVGHRTMVGQVRIGSAAPLLTLYGSSITTVTRRDGALPTSRTMGPWTASSRVAALRAQACIERGKCNAKCAVSNVSQCSSGRVNTCAPSGCAHAASTTSGHAARGTRITGK